MPAAAVIEDQDVLAHAASLMLLRCSVAMR
jgi:hypothetical protein